MAGATQFTAPRFLRLLAEHHLIEPRRRTEFIPFLPDDRSSRSNGTEQRNEFRSTTNGFFHTPRSSQPELPERNCAGPRSYGGVEREVSTSSFGIWNMEFV